MRDPKACPECLHRAKLLELLAPHMERSFADRLDLASIALLGSAGENLAGSVAPELALRLLDRVASLSERSLREELSAAGCWATCRHDDLYPVGLRGDPAAPWALIGRGHSALLERLVPAESVAIVGSRRATSYGREVARGLGHDLAASGKVVVSGLSFGIDACAHRGALDAEEAAAGVTVAVLGCGPDVAYPAAHRSLWRRIGEWGLVVSELFPGAPGWRWSQMARKRIIAALGGMTVVVEAAGRSGSLLAAESAVALGREVGATPGPVTSRASVGPNAILADGGRIVRGAEDILTVLGSGEVDPPAPVAERSALRAQVEALIGEDRVPGEVLAGLARDYGGS
ncbi:MAG TPA: DNA-processing protein DprA [Solirubrobacterales bacterium]|jgi:DNA processing protein|nr:DNA-processing protein DprA [Solirubrobacterales bacterium]